MYVREWKRMPRIYYAVKKGCCASAAAEWGRAWRSMTSISHRRSTAALDIRGGLRLNLSSITPAPCCSRLV